MKFLAPLVAAVAAISVVATAFAHAEPARVYPGDGAVLNEPPAEVVFEMSQEMARQDGQNDIDVFDADGNEVTVVAAVIDKADRKMLSVPLPSNLAPGVYTVRWKTLSAEDGDPDSGETTFTYDPSAPPNPGREVLREDLLNPGGGETPVAPAAISVPTADDGVTWVLVVAVGALMFALGAGGTFLLVQRQA
ncbi:MAG TPA: copper resistance protein CopC [Tepidiformaceae bacterium]|nr:copper resistance protein CopC [Tepidiformaceae bacterium]